MRRLTCLLCREEIEYELTKVKRSYSSDSAQKESLSSEVSALRTKIQDLQSVVEQQTSALENKDRESAQLRLRLSKMQKEAEDNDRKVNRLAFLVCTGLCESMRVH